MWKPRRMDRYVFAETVGPFALGFAVYTFIMLVRFLFQSAEMIIRRGVSAGTVGELLLATLPNIVVLTIPMALLFGILTAVGRLASDSELVALRASGVSLVSLYRPILTLSAVLAVLNTALMLYALPQGNALLQRLRVDILSQSVSRQIEPRVFYEEWEDKILYVFDILPNQERWNGVFLAQSLPTNESEVTVADWGQIKVDEAGERVVLELGDAVTHKVDLNAPDRYQTQRYKHLELVLEEGFSSSRRASMSHSRGVRELTLAELVAQIHDPQLTPEVRNLTRVEVHKKFAIPAACLVFGLFALPLGFNNRRGSKASGFALSILVILVYYVLLNNGEEAARFGKMPPWLAMWLPNLLLAGLGVLLLTRRNRDKSLLLWRLDRWIRQDAWSRLQRLGRLRKAHQVKARRRRQQAAAGQAENGSQVVLRLPRLRLRFPNLMDRYTLRIFGGVFGLVLLSVVSLYLIADLSERLDDILQNHIPNGVVIQYYRYITLQVFYDLSPIIVLITTLISLSLLARSNEVTAAKALGISLYRLSVPVVAAAALVALFSAYLQSEVLPVTNQRAQRLEDRIMGRETPRTYRRVDRWLFGRGGYIYNYLHFDPRAAAMQRLQVFQFGGDHRLRRRLAAANASFAADGGGKAGWLLDDGWARTFDDATGRATSYNRFPGKVRLDLTEPPDFFSSEIRRPEQMRYRELRRYVAQLERSGQQVPELEVQLYNKIAFPVTSVVMALVGLPFAFRLGRQGTLYGIGLSIVLGMVFFGVLAFFAALGRVGALPPPVSVWSPSAVFAVFAVYLFLGVRT
jgi:lipopolysaccharide export system permease protein